MQILTSLGVNSTLWIQLACFLVSYFAITQLIFKPYLAAHRERERRTTGNEETATRLIEEASDLHAEYEKKARAINSDMKAQYDETRMKAMEEYDRLLGAARTESTTRLESVRGEITSEIQAARKALAAEIPALGTAIATKLAGKEISL